MKKNEFFEKLQETLETEAIINENTCLKDLPEYSSLTTLSIIALIDECFGKSLSASELNSIETVKNLIDSIGNEYFI